MSAHLPVSPGKIIVLSEQKTYEGKVFLGMFVLTALNARSSSYDVDARRGVPQKLHVSPQQADDIPAQKPSKCALVLLDAFVGDAPPVQMRPTRAT